jgi:threonine dehydrogenase-like Zn-dependent dehydrogenase
MDSRSFWITGPERCEIRDESLRSPGVGQVLVQALYSGISRGSESLVFHNRVPESQYRGMRAPFQEGDFPAPVKYGYCSVGVVEAGPDDLRGRRVFCLYPHQSRYLVPAAAVVPLPRGVPAARAVLSANLETALNALWDAPPRPAQQVAVIGAGTVGCLIAYLAARVPGCEVELIDIDPDKAEVAGRLGVAFRQPDEARAEVDLVVHASGCAAGLATALRLAGFEATVLEVSWYGDRDVSLPLGEAFHHRRLTIRSSQVGEVALCQRGRWSRRRRLTAAIGLLEDPVLDALISGESRFEDMPAVVPALLSQSRGHLCHRIVYDAKLNGE